MARKTIHYYHNFVKGGFGGGRGMIKKHYGESNNFSLERNARCPWLKVARFPLFIYINYKYILYILFFRLFIRNGDLIKNCMFVYIVELVIIIIRDVFRGCDRLGWYSCRGSAFFSLWKKQWNRESEHVMSWSAGMPWLGLRGLRQSGWWEVNKFLLGTPGEDILVL